MLQNQRNNPVLLRTGNSSVNVSLTSGANPSIIGDNLVFTATISPNTATGAVQFLDGGTPISDAIQLTNGSASFATANLGLGNHAISVRYTGDSRDSASSSAALSQNVVKGNASVNVSLTAGTNPSLVGASLTFTAGVAPANATGTVVFFDGTFAISGNVPLAGGSASFTTAALSAGTHSITAQYSGDGTFNGATSPAFTQAVNTPKANTSTVVVLSVGTNPSTFGATLTFSAHVTPATAAGTVIFFDGANPISGSIPVSSGTASLTTSTLGAGTHSITAQYSGNAAFNGSNSPALTQTVAKAKTAVELDTAERDSSFKPGTPLTFVASITPTNATGTVTFFDGNTPISNAVPVSNGKANFTTSSLSSGTHSISARYSGDANFNSSSSGQLKVKVK
jgi:hypothetical protein